MLLYTVNRLMDNKPIQYQLVISSALAFTVCQSYPVQGYLGLNLSNAILLAKSRSIRSIIGKL